MFLRIPPALYHRNFRLLWLGLMVSMAGSQMQTWALLWHIRTLTDQPLALGLVGLVRIIPIIIFSLIGGSIADVVNRRTVLFITQSAMAGTALALALLTFTGQIALWHMYLLTGLQAIAVAFDGPARQSLVPNLVPAEELPNAFSLTSIAFQVGSIVGPALSGLVIAYLGQGYTYLFNAASYLAVLLVLVMMGAIAQQSSPTQRPAVSLEAIREGIQFIRTHPIILSTMLIDFVATFFASANTLMPIFARDVLKVGEVEYGWLSAAQSIGAMLAALAISQMSNIRRQGTIFLASVMLFGAATIAFGFTRNVALAVSMLVVIGASDSVSTVIRNTIRQLQTPDYIRGRMISINQIFFMGGPQLGEIEAGIAAQLFGAPFAIVSGGIASILIVAWISQRWPVLRAYNGDEPILAGRKVKEA